jgi:hypothetical protein
MAAKAASLRGTSRPYAHFQGGIDAFYDRKIAHQTGGTGPVMGSGGVDGRGLVAGSAMEDLDDASLRRGSMMTRARDDGDVDVDGAALAGGRSSVWDDEVKGPDSPLSIPAMSVHLLDLTYSMPVSTAPPAPHPPAGADPPPPPQELFGLGACRGGQGHRWWRGQAFAPAAAVV